MNSISPKAYIHINRLKENLFNIRRQVGGRPILCVVKANGYGHGAEIIASSIADEPGISFSVFSFEEALDLRKAGISNEILIFSRIQDYWIKRALKHNFIVSASSVADINLLQNMYEQSGKCPRFHIKFDTGMTRLGFDLNESNSVFSFLKKNKKLPLEGIYSHFSSAEEDDLSYAYQQLNAFKQVVNEGQNAGIIFHYIHCSNSGAILNLSDSYFNLVRVGLLLYGANPSIGISMNVNVKPVMSFCGPIVNIRRVLAGTKVSYGGVYTTKKDTNIAVVQTGFADGFPRPWYENGFVSYKGLEYKIAGRPCMDQFMVDFGNAEPKEGDEVLIFGKKNLDELPVERIAEDTGTTSYALLTAIHGRTDYIVLN